MTRGRSLPKRISQEAHGLALVVGPETEERGALARTLIARGHPTIICPGPPACALPRSDRCVLVDTADVIVSMPNGSHRRDVAAALSLCARGARKPVIVEPSAIEQPPLGAEFVRLEDIRSVVATVERALERENGVLGKGAADVADIWL